MMFILICVYLSEFLACSIYLCLLIYETEKWGLLIFVYEIMDHNPDILAWVDVGKGIPHLPKMRKSVLRGLSSLPKHTGNFPDKTANP